MKKIIINLPELFSEDAQAKLVNLEKYKLDCLSLAGEGNDVVLTGPGPVWLYLSLAHILHGKARSLRYSSPVTGEVVIFDHNPF
ncbi:CRISPR-associated protein Csx3 [Desulfonatronovibrio magnus]|uniref:CRISPR-associated protein Csx3 n=1 Tax=Desulfonatronovibrio magnus TaxID=698827 RepID=UPI0005EB44A9|nr:CRISPR-associated protein Csx3 [Desulfonatronovibrio magnus]